MSVMEERMPFTKPLTSGEIRYLKELIDRALRENGRHIVKNNGTHNLDYAREVEDALTAFNEMQPWAVKRLNGEVTA